ncbi:hypothetical protein K523DRAFT_165236 [Schizophyllum commune Tattone D]|nr:hypothetical protein K523DRAFT_165236 [Schizophyllum commune Tattone D]
MCRSVSPRRSAVGPASVFLELAVKIARRTPMVHLRPRRPGSASKTIQQGRRRSGTPSFLDCAHCIPRTRRPRLFCDALYEYALLISSPDSSPRIGVANGPPSDGLPLAS